MQRPRHCRKPIDADTRRPDSGDTNLRNRSCVRESRDEHSPRDVAIRWRPGIASDPAHLGPVGHDPIDGRRHGATLHRRAGRGNSLLAADWDGFPVERHCQTPAPRRRGSSPARRVHPHRDVHHRTPIAPVPCRQSSVCRRFRPARIPRAGHHRDHWERSHQDDLQ